MTLAKKLEEILKDDLKHPKIATLKAPKFVYGYKKN